LIVCTPLAPREVLRYSLTGVRLPKPFSVTTSISWSSRATSIARTSLPLPVMFIPRTPPVARPIARASASSKRTASPSLETMRISSPGSTRRTATSSSSSRMLIAMMPSALIGVLYSPNSVFLMTPFFVANTR
jgi:hypothetical protein